jgi:tape measure domain-containing protein
MAITVQEAQVLFSSDGLTKVQSQAGIAGRALDKATTAAGGFTNKLRGVGSALSGVGGMIAGLGAGAAAGWMAKLAAGAEQTSIAFEVLLGSSAASKQMVDDIRALDMKTVFGARELGDSAKMMLNYGIAGQSVVPMLARISDIASGDSMKLEGLTRAFGQMAATGRLMGQDLNQMIQNGFNPLEEISRRTGVSMGVLKKQMEAGGISAEMVAKAFESATSQGGRFYGMNDRMSQTTAGQFAKLQSNIEMLAIEIGTVLLPEANKIIEWATKLVTSVDGAGKSFKTMVTEVKTWYQAISDNVADIGVVFGTVVGNIGMIWRNMFDDITGYAKAFFDWVASNASVMGQNIAIHWRNAQQMLQGNFDRTTYEPDKSFTAFRPPGQREGDNTTLWQKIQDELATARKLRQEENQPKKDGKPKGIDELKNDRKRGEFGSSGTPEASGGGKSQSLSAEALFGSLRQGALDKQLGLMGQGINLQQQQLAAANQMVAKLDKFNVGLA